MAEVFEADVMGLITVSLIDKSKFKFSFKSTTTAAELVAQVCEKVGVRQTIYFGLKRLRNLRSEVDEEVAAKVWVSEKAPLFAQGCDSSTTLFFRHKYWFYDVDEIVDPVTMQLIFEETDRKLMSDKFENTEDVNVQLAALRVQLAQGEHIEGGSYVTEETIRYIIPAYAQGAHTIEEWGKMVAVFHQKLRGKPKINVQMEYLQLAKDNTRLLQVGFFPAQYSTRDMHKKVDILVGVTPDGIGFYSNKPDGRRQLQVFHRYRELASWVINPLWNGQEAPDYERPKSSDVMFELEDYPVGPYRNAFFMKTKSRRTKDVEFEVSSFIQEDDTLTSFLNTYTQRFETHVRLLELDDSRERVLTVNTLDGVSKKLRVTQETSGQDLINTFAEKINLQDTSFFQLSHVTDGADRWLSLKEPIVLQGLTPFSNIQLKLRFFFKDPLEVKDVVARGLYFLQIKDRVVNGDIPVSEDDAIELAALYLQTVVGDYDKKLARSGYFHNSLKQYIPFYLADFHGRSWWEKKIFNAHEKHVGQSRDDIITKYLKIVSALPNYGITYFAGIIPKTEEECLIGVSKLGLALFKIENMELIASYRFGYELRTWSNDGEAIEVKVKPSRNAEEKIIAIVSLQFAEVIDLLSYYDKMRRFHKKMQQTDAISNPKMDFD